MGKGRKSTWTTEEDELIATTVLSSKQSGGTIAGGIKTVSSIIGRSYPACSQRWNYVRTTLDGYRVKSERVTRQETMRKKESKIKEAQIHPITDQPTGAILYQFGEYKFAAVE